MKKHGISSQAFLVLDDIYNCGLSDLSDLAIKNINKTFLNKATIIQGVSGKELALWSDGNGSEG